MHPGVQGSPQKPRPQSPVHSGQLPLQEEELTVADEQPLVVPSKNPPTPEGPIMDFADPQFPTVFKIVHLISWRLAAHS